MEGLLLAAAVLGLAETTKSKFGQPNFVPVAASLGVKVRISGRGRSARARADHEGRGRMQEKEIRTADETEASPGLADDDQTKQATMGRRPDVPSKWAMRRPHVLSQSSPWLRASPGWRCLTTNCPVFWAGRTHMGIPHHHPAAALLLAPCGASHLMRDWRQSQGTEQKPALLGCAWPLLGGGRASGMRSNGLHRTVRAPPPGPLAGFAFGGPSCATQDSLPRATPRQHTVRGLRRDNKPRRGAGPRNSKLIQAFPPAAVSALASWTPRPWRELSPAPATGDRRRPPREVLGSFPRTSRWAWGLRWVRSKEQNGEERSASQRQYSLAVLPHRKVT